MSEINNNNFLALTRENETSLAPFSFSDAAHHFEVWDTGVLLVAPKSPTNFDKAVVLSAGVHGNETAPIELINELITELLNAQLVLKRPVLFIFGNPASMNINKRFVVENMNRLFVGNHAKGTDVNGNSSNLERVRAKKLEEYVARFYERFQTPTRCLYDLHTAIKDSVYEKFAVYPYLHGKPWKKQEFELLRAMDVTTVMLMPTPATTFSYHASKVHDADSFTIELGKVRGFGENDKAKFEKAKMTLRDLICGIDVDPENFDEDNFVMFAVHRSIIKNFNDFQLGFSDSLPNFSQFQVGDTLASENGQDIVAEVEGEGIVFPNANVEIGQRAILTVIPTEVSKNSI